jgi:hypothetical protein
VVDTQYREKVRSFDGRAPELLMMPVLGEAHALDAEERDGREGVDQLTEATGSIRDDRI